MPLISLSTWQTRFNNAFCNLFYHRYQQRVNRPLTAVFYLDSNSSCQEFPQLYFDYLTSNNFGKKPVSVNITTEIDFSVISVQQILNTIRLQYQRSVVIVVVFYQTQGMQNACRGFSYFRREAAKLKILDDSVSLVTELDSLDITSDTKEQDHMTSKSAILSCDKILSHFEEGGGNFEFLLFCGRVRGRSWPRNLSFGPLLLVITSHD